MCRESSSDNLRSGFIGGKIGVDRGDIDAARLLSPDQEGMGDEDPRGGGAGSLVVSDSTLAMGGLTFPFNDTGISDVAVCPRLVASGKGSS